jgi:DNA-binding HxlR family transcriptional regulator
MIPPEYLVGTVTVTENLLKRKWSVIILRHIKNGLTDPAAICKLEPGLSPVVMNERLRTMLRYNLITRNPIRLSAKLVEYRLTTRGQQILRMLSLIEQMDKLTDPDALGLDRVLTDFVPPVDTETKRVAVQKRKRKTA